MSKIKIADFVPVFNHTALRWLAPAVEDIIWLTRYNRIIYETEQVNSSSIYEIPKQVINYFSISIESEPQLIQNIPKSGSVILASEHPTDLMDHLIIMYLLGQVRQDYKFTANDVAAKLKLWNDIIFPLSLYGEKDTASKNSTSIRQAIKWLKEKHALITYPGARPSSLSARIRQGREYWSALPILLAEKTGAVILPVQLRLAEPKWQLILKKHCRPIYNLFTFYIPHSLKNTTAKIKIGSPLRYEDLPKELSREQQAQWLKKQVESL